MICERCGKNFQGGKRVRIEGGVVVACDACASLGEVVGPAVVKEKPRPVLAKRTQPPSDVKIVEDSFDLIEGYGRKIKAAREKKNLKQEELGKMVNEPASFIHHMELEHAEPTVEVARKLQAKLGVRLLTPHIEENVDVKANAGRELTLGDVVVVKTKRRGE